MSTQRNTVTTAPEVFDLFGVALQFLIPPSGDTQQVSVYSGTLPPGVPVPLHSHPEAELFYVLDGVMEIYRETGTPNGWISLPATSAFVVPGGVKHALRNTSDKPFTTLLTTQGNLYEFFRTVAEPLDADRVPAPPTPEKMGQFITAAEKFHYRMASPEENAAIGLTMAAPGSP